MILLPSYKRKSLGRKDHKLINAINLGKHGIEINYTIRFAFPLTS